jgi:S1-C subfamily serine protease
MVTSNALQRTFHIRFKGQSGTAFTIDVDDRQYLVTARHIVNEAGPVNIEIYNGSTWRPITCAVVGRGSDNADITVLAAPQQISPPLSLSPTTDGLILGQDIHFLGFPLGLKADVPQAINADFPLPLVKKGCVSLLALSDPHGAYVLLDGHNNPGFSGGPVVFHPHNAPPHELRVAAVVSGYHVQSTPVQGGGAHGHFVHANSGIMIAYSIRHATDMIASNPIGFALPKAA